MREIYDEMWRIKLKDMVHCSRVLFAKLLTSIRTKQNGIGTTSFTRGVTLDNNICNIPIAPIFLFLFCFLLIHLMSCNDI